MLIRTLMLAVALAFGAPALAQSAQDPTVFDKDWDIVSIGDELRFALGVRDGEAGLLNLNTGSLRLIARTIHPYDEATLIRRSPDGNKVAIATTRTLHIFDLNEGRYSPQALGARVIDMAWDASSTALAYWQDNRILSVYPLDHTMGLEDRDIAGQLALLADGWQRPYVLGATAEQAVAMDFRTGLVGPASPVMQPRIRDIVAFADGSAVLLGNRLAFETAGDFLFEYDSRHYVRAAWPSMASADVLFYDETGQLSRVDLERHEPQWSHTVRDLGALWTAEDLSLLVLSVNRPPREGEQRGYGELVILDGQTGNYLWGTLDAPGFSHQAVRLSADGCALIAARDLVEGASETVFVSWDLSGRSPTCL